jgi:hypothetical protein
MRTIVALVIASSLAVACTETPSDLPPCLGVYGSTSCPASEAGADTGASDGSNASDAAAPDGALDADDASNTQ